MAHQTTPRETADSEGARHTETALLVAALGGGPAAQPEPDARREGSRSTRPDDED
jgi:hypothetical protein